MSQEQQPKRAKATKLEKEKRVFTIQSWILDGVQDNLILKQAKNQWGIGLRQARKYLKKAYENWKEEESIDMDSRKSAKIAELQQLKRSLKPEFKGTPAGIKAVISVEKEIIRLQPYSIKRIDVTSAGKPVQLAKRTIIIKERNPDN